MKSKALLFIILILHLEVSSQNPISKFFSSVAKIWQPVWGEYSEGSNTNRNPPLTTFDRGIDVYWGPPLPRESFAWLVSLLILF
jgi:hypothetical protein